ncbi:hypothetical protein NE237_031736 [Protea cynaroides]|uniref:DEK-C domain-containing protein n=1 Tax=Protea cynaroides TaxID=273540 RepID=A0A9Q0L218_9MAGN|nr:hypothetical protein NE237_031736 [Protea cynaroides]
MAEAETETKVAEDAANGTCPTVDTGPPENTGEAETLKEEEAVTLKKEKDANGIKEMEEGSKENEKNEDVEMDGDQKLKEEECEQEIKEEGLEEPEDVKMEEETETKEEKEGKEIVENTEEKEEEEAKEVLENTEEKEEGEEGKEVVENTEEKEEEEGKEVFESAEEKEEGENKENVETDEEKVEENKENVETDEEKEEENKENVETDEEKEGKKSKEHTESAEEKEEEIVEAKESKREKGYKRRVKGPNVKSKEEAKQNELDEKNAKEASTPMVSSIDRPVRERKSVERLVVSIEKGPAKGFRIEKGQGTPLKEIPNVAYKLSRKKTDETFKSLYMILFGRRGKASDVKKNISQFSGFVWHENEDKQRMKLKEKFDKCFKEKLLEFCDVLDISVVKTTTKKEDIVVKLIDFLAAPHATTDVLLAEKEQPSKVRKRKRSVKGTASKSGGASAKRSLGKRRMSGDTLKEQDKRSARDTGDESSEEDDDENDNGVPDATQEILNHSENEDKEDESVEESEEDTRKRKRGSKKSSSKKESAGKTIMKKHTTSRKVTQTTPPKKTPIKSSSKHSKVDDISDKSPRVFSRKKKIETKKKTSTPAKSATKEKAGLKVVKGKDKSREEEPGPSEDELRNAICEILKEVDFNTATFTDILKLLARQEKIMRMMMGKVMKKKIGQLEVKRWRLDCLHERYIAVIYSWSYVAGNRSGIFRQRVVVELQSWRISLKLKFSSHDHRTKAPQQFRKWLPHCGIYV